MTAAYIFFQVSTLTFEVNITRMPSFAITYRSSHFPGRCLHQHAATTSTTTYNSPPPPPPALLPTTTTGTDFRTCLSPVERIYIYIYMQQSYGGIVRRQQQLIRCLVGNYCSKDTLLLVKKGTRMQSVIGGGGHLEVEALSILRSISPALDSTKHKGQAGKIAVIGGCREYTGAPYFAAISALKIGADLSHVFCTKDAAPVIKGYSPELIVHPLLEESYNVRDEDKTSISIKVLDEVDKWMERFDCLVIGPGLGRDPFLLDCVSDIMRHARRSNVPMVIDGDGLFLVTNSIDLVSGYPLAVLTPNVNEYKRLVNKVLNCEVNDQDGPQQLLSLAKSIGGVTVLRKGQSDYISDGEAVRSVSIYGSPRRCGGQGDILSGSVAVFVAWARELVSKGKFDANPTMLGCIAGSALVRKAASVAFEDKKRSTLTTDIIECLGRSLEALCPVGRKSQV